MKKTLYKISSSVAAGVGALQLAAGAALAQKQPSSIRINPNEGSSSQSFAANIGVVFRAVLNFVLIIAVLLVFGYLVLGGIEWITSGGDKGKTESARNKITAAVIGLIILISSYAILTVVLQFLGLNTQELTIPSIKDFQ